MGDISLQCTATLLLLFKQIDYLLFLNVITRVNIVKIFYIRNAVSSEKSLRKFINPFYVLNVDIDNIYIYTTC